MKKVMIILGIIIIIAIIVILAFYKYNKDHILDGGNTTRYTKEFENLISKNIIPLGKMTCIYTSYSGDMNGNVDEIKIDAENLTLTTTYSEGYPEDKTINVYKIDNESIKKLDDFIRQYNIAGWEKLKLDEENFILDAAVRSFNFEYDNSSVGGKEFESYHVSESQKIPDEGFDVLKDLLRMIEELKIEDNLINTYTEEY